MEHQPYRLVFEGPVDDNEETLRTLKATFIAELDYSITEVQDALLNAPITLRSAEGEDELVHYYTALKGAGASVLIVKPESEEICEDFAENEQESDDELIFELEVDDLLQEPEPEKKQPKNTTYSLDFNPDDAPVLSEESSDEVTESELSFDSLEDAEELSNENVAVEQKEPLKDSDLSLSFNDGDTPALQEESDADHNLLTEEEDTSQSLKDEDAGHEEFALSFEEPETTEETEDTEEASALEEADDLSVPDEPLFSFDDEEEQENTTQQVTPNKEEEKETDLSIPDEPLFAFDEEDSHESEVAEEPLEKTQSDETEEPSSTLLFAEEHSKEEQQETPLETQDEVEAISSDEVHHDVSGESEVDEGQILDALGSIDQAFEETLAAEQELSSESAASSIDHLTETDSKTGTLNPPSLTAEEEHCLSVEEQRSEDVSESTNPLPTNSTTTKTAPTTHNSLAIVLLVIIFSASAFLIYLNFLRDPAQNGLTEEAIAKAIQSSALAAKKQLTEQKIAEKKAKEQAVASKKLTFRKLESHVEADQIDTEWSLTARGPRIISGTMKIQTTKPPELTPEEIVRGVQERPWLRKVDLFSLNFSSTDGKIYTESTQARAYIEQGDVRRRVVAHADIALEFDPENDQLQGTIVLTYPENLAEPTEPMTLERKNGKFELYLKYRFIGTAGGKVPEE